MTKHKLTRTCASCGIDKPLSAFLEISSSHGSRYGQICATCRAAGKGVPHHKTSDDETVTVPSGARLGSKERVFIEKEQKRQVKDLKDLFKKEAQKKEAFSEKKIEETEIKEKERKEHKIYSEGKKQGFLSTKTPASAQTEVKRAATARTIEQHERVLETKRQEDVIRQEFLINSIDLTSPIVDTTMTKYQTDAFKQFAAWLGSDAPIVRTLHLLYGTKQTAAKPSTFLQEKKHESGEKKELKGKEAIEDYVEKRWNPTSRSR